MQPIKFTARALRRIALTACLDKTRPHLCALRFCPSDVLATDGTILVRVPLPHDPERDFVLPSVPTVEALRTLRRDVTVTLTRCAGETRLSAPLGYDFAISDDADISVDRYPSVEVVIDATQEVGTVADAHLSARMWIRVGKLARDLISVGDRHRDDAPIRILKAGSVPGKGLSGGHPAHLAFTTAHGDALAVVMPVRK
jgi:hypothetical protein